jgi:hypothetical protein
VEFRNLALLALMGDGDYHTALAVTRAHVHLENVLVSSNHLSALWMSESGFSLFFSFDSFFVK